MSAKKKLAMRGVRFCRFPHETNRLLIFGKTLFRFSYTKFSELSIFAYCQFAMRFYFLQLLLFRFSLEVFEPIHGQTVIRFTKFKSSAIDLLVFSD